MSFDWENYNFMSRELVNYCLQHKPVIAEAYYRSSISRSYYSAFWYARKRLEGKGIPIPPEKVHKFVKDKYVESKIDTEKKVGSNLSRLLSNRLDADYNDNIEINYSIADTSIKTAKNIIDTIKQLP